eukprot:767277-Hanusia_phi.AAC.3
MRPGQRPGRFSMPRHSVTEARIGPRALPGPVVVPRLGPGAARHRSSSAGLKTNYPAQILFAAILCTSPLYSSTHGSRWKSLEIVGNTGENASKY